MIFPFYQIEAQWPPAQSNVASRLQEGDEEGGGIDIEKAKKFMAEEDVHDKQVYKERIKQKHLVRYKLTFTQYSYFSTKNVNIVMIVVLMMIVII